MKILFLVGVMVSMSSGAFAQVSHGDSSLATPTGHEVSANAGSYTYREPSGDQPISISGAKFGGEYTGTWSINKRRRWFVQANLRGTVGNVDYNGWCSPFLIAPNSDSPNGYELDIGDPSPCTESGDKDWYVEGRALAGKDVVGRRWGFSPFAGIGLRHLSNGTSGVAGYRTDNYLYLPLGVTARTNVAARRTLSVTLEFDPLIHGWQTTRDSNLGGGDVPATATAPEFTIDGFTDISFAQSGGWALRASAKFPVTPRWSVEPYYVRWSVKASPVNNETVTFTVNGVSASEQLEAFEPVNATNEFGVKLGFHF